MKAFLGRVMLLLKGSYTGSLSANRHPKRAINTTAQEQESYSAILERNTLIHKVTTTSHELPREQEREKNQFKESWLRCCGEEVVVWMKTPDK